LQKENRWTTFKPPAAGQSSRYRGLILHRRSHEDIIEFEEHRLHEADGR